MNKPTPVKVPGELYPQTVEIPDPLEIHPSVDPELARGLIAAVEYIDQHPEEFRMDKPYFNEAGQGCVICHAERLSNWKRPKETWEGFKSDGPLGHWSRIFHPSNWNGFHGGLLPNGEYEGPYYFSEPRQARIEHFLRTGA